MCISEYSKKSSAQSKIAKIMNISFTKKQEIYINKQVETGDYQNNSEVIRDALRLHEIYREKVITDLRNEIS